MGSCQMLLRKEVIQPHLPVRLPCYDFTLIADSTFDSSVPCGVNLVVRGGMWSEETNSYELIPQDPTVCLIQ